MALIMKARIFDVDWIHREIIFIRARPFANTASAGSPLENLAEKILIKFVAVAD